MSPLMSGLIMKRSPILATIQVTGPLSALGVPASYLDANWNLEAALRDLGRKDRKSSSVG
jgi:hypothetical protein